MEIETDKAGMDVEAVEDGILAKILASFLELFWPFFSFFQI